jgi:hypothetical protein
VHPSNYVVFGFHDAALKYWFKIEGENPLGLPEALLTSEKI